MAQFRRLSLSVLAVVAVCGLVGWAALGPLAPAVAGRGVVAEVDASISHDLGAAVARVNRLFQDRWAAQRVASAGLADELQVVRRLSLALVGTVPSLAEVREFEEDSRPDRLRRWTVRLIADRRFADYFAERLAVAFAGSFEQEVPWFTRARFEAWLADQLAAGRPYDEMVRRMISATGPPTSNGAANFLTAEIVQGDQYANRLAARSARAFLGQRIDCAECHDHPFDDWKQSDFQGLAAHFAQVRTRSIGIEDDAGRQHEVEGRKTPERRVIEPRVPFHPEWRNEHDGRRRQLADWITHRENRRFLRAISNRVWGLLFGRPFVAPVDSLPDPRKSANPEESDAPGAIDEDETELLDVLADDLREHGGDLRRLVLVITSSRPFRLASTYPAGATAADSERLDGDWAVFPLVQLRPEQLARSLEQAASIRPLLPGASVFTRTRRELWMRKFLDQYGTLGENELEGRTESIPQAIHRVQSRFIAEKSRAEWTGAAGRIAAFAPDASACLETCYLACLTRHPTVVERAHFLAQLRDAGAKNRRRVVEDIFWTLFNSPEFGWNH